MSQKLGKSTTIVAGMTMLSRLLGFVRDVVLAQVFGAGAEFDAFVVAFKIPNFMRRLFAEGAFAQAFVPIMSEYQTKHSQEATQEFVNRIAGTLGLILLLLVAVVEIIAPLVIMVFAPGFLHDPVRLHLAQHLLRITFPYIFFISLTAFAGATLNTCNRFAIPAFTPVLLNVALIGAALLAASLLHGSIHVLAWGVFTGGVLQLLLQIPVLKQHNLLPKPKVYFKDPGVRRVMKLMVPALFGVSVAQLSLLIDNIFASYLPAGSISWLYYSDRLTYLPLGVIGVALSTVVMPHLSRQHSNNQHQDFSKTLDWALQLALLIGVPAALGLLILAGPILSTLIQHGEFTVRDVLMTRQSLMAYAIGLPGFMLVKILASGFYSQQNIKTPVKIAAAAMLLNLCLNAALIFPLKHAGLALATSISSLFNAIALLLLLKKRQVYRPKCTWLTMLIKLIIANSAMVLLLIWIAAPVSTWMQWHSITRIWHLAYVILSGILLYILMLWLLGFRLKNFKSPV